VSGVCVGGVGGLRRGRRGVGGVGGAKLGSLESAVGRGFFHGCLESQPLLSAFFFSFLCSDPQQSKTFFFSI
jgi:hypothetical protein